MEFTTQWGPFQVYLVTALLHINPKKIKEKNLEPKKAKKTKKVHAK